MRSSPAIWCSGGLITACSRQGRRRSACRQHMMSALAAEARALGARECQGQRSWGGSPAGIPTGAARASRWRGKRNFGVRHGRWAPTACMPELMEQALRNSPQVRGRALRHRAPRSEIELSGARASRWRCGRELPRAWRRSSWPKAGRRLIPACSRQGRRRSAPTPAYDERPCS